MIASHTPLESNGPLMTRHTRRIDSGEIVNPVRLAFYSHDAMGVGHVRRNLLIAQRLSEPPINGTSLIICGMHEATAFTGGHGIDCLTLPSFEKHGNDDYRPRDLRLATEVVSNIRTESLRSGMIAMAPDILVVDKVPRGLHDELVSVLPELRQRGTRLVFGMRDVLDSPERIAKEWRQHGYEEFIRTNYDAVWIYGDPQIFDTIGVYGLESLRGMARYTGYLDQRERLRYASPLDRSTRESYGDLEKTVLCMVGGGQDGGQLAEAFAQSEFPAGMQGLLVTGPLMNEQQCRRVLACAGNRPDLRVVRHVRDADLLMPDVHKVICMGGYNSMMSVVSFSKPSLIVPRVRPREEQRIRAERFEELGLLEMLPPEQLTADSLTSWMARDSHNVRTRTSRIDLGGLDRIAEFASELVPVTSCNRINHKLSRESS